MATRSNHGSLPAHASDFPGQNMADRMRANPIGVWNGAYNATSYR